MKNLLILFSIVLFLAADTQAQGTGMGTGKPYIQVQLEGFIASVIDQNSSEAVSFMNPDYVKKLGGRQNAIEAIETEFEISKSENLKIVGVTVKPASKPLSFFGTPQKIKVAVEVKADDVSEIFDGEITAVLINEEWYFFHQKTLLESFGIKEFEKEIVENSKESPDEMINAAEKLNDRAISLPSPEYPKAAKAVNAKGTVDVEVVIDEKGNVVSAEAVSGHPLLRASAVEAAARAKFKPFALNGQNVKARGTLSYNFTP